MTHTYVDFELTEERDIHIDETGDIGTVRDADGVVQDSVIDVFGLVADELGSTVTPTRLERVRSRLRESLQSNEYVETVYGPSIVDVTDNGVEMEVFINNDESFHFTI